MKQLDIFDILNDVPERPEPKFKKGDRAKVRQPYDSDDAETIAVLSKYNGEKVIVVSSYWSETYNQYAYLLSFIKENLSISLLENDLI